MRDHLGEEHCPPQGRETFKDRELCDGNDGSGWTSRGDNVGSPLCPEESLNTGQLRAKEGVPRGPLQLERCVFPFLPV